MARGKNIIPKPDFGKYRKRCIAGPYEGHWFMPEDLVANMAGRVDWWRNVSNFAVFNFLLLDEVRGMDTSEYEETAIYGHMEDGLGYVVLGEWLEW